MMTKNVLISVLLSLTLTSCAAQKSGEEMTISAEKRAEVFSSKAFSSKAIEIDTLTERFLPTGVLEIGERNAANTLLMFTEHHCKYCEEFQDDHFPKLRQDFIDRGDLRLQIFILPLDKYSESEDAAIAFLCAAEQGKGIAMHNLLFQKTSKSESKLLAYAKEIGLNSSMFRACIESDRGTKYIDSHASFARSLQVTLVPTFFLNGKRSVGLPFYPDLRGMIQEEINE